MAIDIERLHEAVIETIITAMKGQDIVYTIEGAPMATLKMPDDTFRKKPVFGGQELFFDSCYIGKSGKLILVFKPVDDMPWVQAEFSPRELDTALPLFGTQLAEKLGFDGEDLPAVIEWLLEDTPKRWEREAEEQRKAAAVVYDTNPNFGRF